MPGRKYIADNDLKTINCKHGGKYVVARRTQDRDGAEVLNEAAAEAIKNDHRLFGFFGVKDGHLPYQTADGDFDPTRGNSKADKYSKADISENPTLAQMATAALTVLEKNELGFYLMVEAGDVDWANHQNNIDNSIGAVFSGDDAFKAIVQWVEENSSWEETQLVVTADHGHLFFMDDVNAFNGKLKPLPAAEFKVLRDKHNAVKAAKRKKAEAAQKAKQKAATEKAGGNDSAADKLAAEKKAAARKARRKAAREKAAKEKAAADKAAKAK